MQVFSTTDMNPEIMGYINEKTGIYDWEMPKPVGWNKEYIPQFEYNVCVSCAAGFTYGLDTTSMRTIEESDAGARSLTLGMASMIALPVGLYALPARSVLTGTVLGSGFDAAGQLIGGNKYRPGQTVVAGITGGFTYPLAGVGLLGSMALGGTYGGSNRALNNYVYDEDKNVWRSAGVGFVAGGFGYKTNEFVSKAASKFKYLPKRIGGSTIDLNKPILLQNIGVLTPYPAHIGKAAGQSSVPDTGKVSGEEYDASLTVSVGLYDSVSVSGSVGVGKTTGPTDWVESQTRIIARDGLDLRAENHTQLDGALLASNTDNLKLDTDTLGFRDLEGHDKERSWYVNAGGTYTWGGDSGNAAEKTGVVDSSQDNKEGSNQWNVSGYHSEKEREQIVRATVGKGDVIVRNDEETGHDSTQGLNRDTNKAYEITKDKKETTELYVSSSSLDAVSHPIETAKGWANEITQYDEKIIANFEQLSVGANVGYNRIERALGRQLVNDPQTSEALAEQALEFLLLSGMSFKEAKSLVTDDAFQNKVLAQLSTINSLTEAQILEAGQVVAGHSASEAETNESWANSGYTPDPNAPILDLGVIGVIAQEHQHDALQVVLRSSAEIQKYIEDNPEKALGVGVDLSALQGPKGLMQLAVMQALSGTVVVSQVRLEI